MNIDISFLTKDLVGLQVPKPLSGTLSGHAAGEPFDKHVHLLIKKAYPAETFRQYEYLNRLYLTHPQARTVTQRHSLIKEPALAFLLNRGQSATASWAPNSLFEEKQDDTADVLVVKDNFYNIIDNKTFNIRKQGQPPNIISCYKLALMCAIMIDAHQFDTHDITYIGISWELDGENLVCREAATRELFKSNPPALYINWAAALQIQFHVEALDQTFHGTRETWCYEYLQHFVAGARDRVLKMDRTFIQPFLKYLK
jgi:hypothetical protein